MKYYCNLKLSVFLFNIFKSCIYSFDGKAAFSASLLQSSVSNHSNMLIWCSRNIPYYYYQCWKQLCCLCLWKDEFKNCNELLLFEIHLCLLHYKCLSLLKHLISLLNKSIFLVSKMISAVKWLITINRTQNKSFCLHNINMCAVYIYHV